MKVIVASTYVPFVDGGGRMIVRDLVSALEDRGHEVDTVEIPFLSDWRQMPAQMLAIRMMDLADRGDRLIAIRTPSYLLRHRRKVLWFIHHHRGAYDLWGTPYQHIPYTPEGLSARRALRQADDIAFAEASRIYTNSGVVRDRLRRFNGVDADVLYPPLAHPERFTAGRSQDYLIYVSRLTHHKRQWLAMEAMARHDGDVRLVIAGVPDNPEHLERLERLAETSGGRITLLARWISDAEKEDLIRHALGVLYIPLDEDSYGYPTLEAFHAGKPVITCTDSGGTLELITDGVNGIVAEPTPEALAAAIRRLADDRVNAERMGRAGAASIDDLGIGWDRVVAALTG